MIHVATALIALAAIQGRGDAVFAAQATAGGTAISNTASATWQDNRGSTYSISSNRVTATVAAVSALAVTPKEASANPKLDSYPAGTQVTKSFAIANVSNIADAYRITALTVDKGRILSAAFVSGTSQEPLTAGSTVSPQVQPGGSIGVSVVIDTTGIPEGTSYAVHITAQTTANSGNGTQSDSGEEWLVAGAPSSLAGPQSPDTPVQKTVDSQTAVQAQPSGAVTYEIAVKNYGGAPATHAVLTDAIPDGLTVEASSVTLNGAPATASLSGQTLTVQLGSIAPGETDSVEVPARVADLATIGTSFVNVASLAADGMSPLSTTPAAVLVGTADIVYDPAQNDRAVPGATVALLDANGNLVDLSGNAAADAARSGSRRHLSANTQNPYMTGSDGAYGFALLPSQIAAGGSTFYITVSAPGFLNRRIELRITPQQNRQLYSVVYTSKDGEPVARAGAYQLTDSSVELSNVFGLFGNIPLFKSQTLVVGKTVNRTSAEGGDRLIYTIDVSNASPAALGAVSVVDTLPPGEAYGTGSARLDGAASEPAVDGRTLKWTLPDLPGGKKHEIVYAAVVFPSVAAGSTLTNSVTADSTIAGTIVRVTASANADVEIVGGALSDRSVLMGRVFVDAAHNGIYRRGDAGVGGVRIYLEDGTSVVTDAQGRFTFPALRPGMHVLRLDTSTLPSGLHGDHLQRLVHGLLDDGLMNDVEFPLEGSP